VIRTLTHAPLIAETYGRGTPRYARIAHDENLGSPIFLGLKGEC
jgi:hypothetical protein